MGLADRVGCVCSSSGQSSVLQPQGFCLLFPPMSLPSESFLPDIYSFGKAPPRIYYPSCLIYISPGCEDQFQTEGLLERSSELQDVGNRAPEHLRLTLILPLIGSVTLNRLSCFSILCFPTFGMKLFALEGLFQHLGSLFQK